NMPSNEQNWMALQYVLGEFSDADRDAFEQRLIDEPELCEAVAQASLLVSSTRAALEPAVVPVAPQPQRGSWLAVAATSASVAALGLFAMQLPTAPRSAQRDPAAAELVSLWESGGDDGDLDDADADSADAAGDVSVPGWMLAAVSLESDNPDDKVQEN